jgi:hypothetical protein
MILNITQTHTQFTNENVQNLRYIKAGESVAESF